VLFAERVINAWNSLPSDTVDFSTLTIKRSIQITNYGSLRLLHRLYLALY